MSEVDNNYSYVYILITHLNIYMHKKLWIHAITSM